ncbi:MAG: hypothetical protein JSR93_06820 [Verrucomicrobia bacterium]|nr:hypothetical protein [Verrucomicrobiota bacterium]
MSHPITDASSPFVYSPPPSPVKRAEAIPDLKSPPRSSAAVRPFDSPVDVKSPMKYHYYEELPESSRRELRGFRGKAHHSIAPDSSKKQVRVIQRNYSEIRKLSKLSFEDTDVSARRLLDEAGGAEIVVRSEREIEVRLDGRRRIFGVHETVTREQKKQCRLYPKEGTGIICLEGPEVLSLIDGYKQQDDMASFQAFVVASVCDEDGYG